MLIRREIVKIDEEKCDGCGQCVPACAEGALKVVDGKARLISEIYCDGLGACLGECPRGAIIIEEREAEEFDLEAAHRHLTQRSDEPRSANAEHAGADFPTGGCPGAAARVLARESTPMATPDSGKTAQGPSRLGNWPVQLRLAPVRAPYFDGSKLLIAADCVPFAFSDFHMQFLAGKTLLIGCPKLDDADLYRRKLAQMLLQNDIRKVELVYMEVPCCYGLVHLVQQALKDSGKDIPLALTKISIKGDILEATKAQDARDEGRKSA